MNLKLLSLLALSSVPVAMAGPFAYALCQTGCNTVTVACYAAAGFTFGSVAAAAAPSLLVGCNTAQGACMAACAATALLAPVP
ncbi:hypothetical protein BKA82DRAFT_1006901 [Pisolithus tinctorius]|uniref:Cysteine-rich protein n=1 Tax=Pisolithus tinctorius Marx 270 TaxID=870435 RepID=A0A0C3IGW2_PISTI|nr:hypothetical protein BKA82DRAFT_1006901 [Pisolithus tinctorius]KIN96282.1 hypothetical protein M404DRAFT_1006901 [Pisolithus tinctorius Marx 270]